MVGSAFKKWKKGCWAVHRHAGQTAGGIHLDFDDHPVEADDSTRKDAGKHDSIVHEVRGLSPKNWPGRAASLHSQVLWQAIIFDEAFCRVLVRQYQETFNGIQLA